ncbi:YggT family protein [Fusobacterium sp. PH5-44]|uniref:YggT family protein n=1 Tax=unclassified Fusobacterium TaxID=2648384 RepID=UPI003D1BCB9F
MSIFFRIVSYIIYFTVILVFIRCILSWLPGLGNNQVGTVIYKLTDPILDPVRKLLPRNRANIDLSPIVVFILLSFLSRVFMWLI